MSRTMVPSRRFAGFDEMTSGMERMFESVLSRGMGNARSAVSLTGTTVDGFLPTLDLVETPEGFQVSIDLPGIKPEEVKIELHQNRLQISGQRTAATQREEAQLHYSERVSGAFARTLALPTEVDQDQIDAHYEHGVLHIKLPKSPKSQPRAIDIRMT